MHDDHVEEYFLMCTELKEEKIKEILGDGPLQAKKDLGWVSQNTFTEAEWVRNGEALMFEGGPWYPQDSVENILDSEVYPIGEYRGVQIFVEFTDVKPYDQMYTRFAKNKYRLFQQKTLHD